MYHILGLDYQDNLGERKRVWLFLLDVKGKYLPKNFSTQRLLVTRKAVLVLALTAFFSSFKCKNIKL
jgi:hypothetical protein